jgi:hypothetical protein
MATILFTCPNTAFKVQHELSDDEEVSDDNFESVDCPSCTRVHFVNRKGKVLGAEEE